MQRVLETGFFRRYRPIWELGKMGKKNAEIWCTRPRPPVRSSVSRHLCVYHSSRRSLKGGGTPVGLLEQVMARDVVANTVVHGCNCFLLWRCAVPAHRTPTHPHHSRFASHSPHRPAARNHVRPCRTRSACLRRTAICLCLAIGIQETKKKQESECGQRVRRRPPLGPVTWRWWRVRM